MSSEALQRHYVFVTEFLWSVVEPDFEHGQVVTIFDMQGVGMRDLAGEALGFVKVCQFACFFVSSDGNMLAIARVDF